MSGTGGAGSTGDGRSAPVAGDTPDGELLARFRAGDAAVVALVGRWVHGAAVPFRFRLGGELEDVEQEVLLALTEAVRAGRFEGRSSFATYVRRTTLYKCVSRNRRHRRWQTTDVEELDPPSGEPGPEQEARAREEVRASLRIVARMSEGCRRLWSMLHEGLDYAAMSAVLGVAPGTLRVRVLRCRQKALAEWRRETGTER